jgi:putative ABC transport system permease protein
MLIRHFLGWHGLTLSYPSINNQENSNRCTMFKNNLKIAWRNLFKDTQFTLLNLVGLSVGLACTLLIYLWVNDEIGFDHFKGQQPFQLMEHRKSASGITISDESSGILGETLKAAMPQIEYAAAVAPPDWFQRFTLSVGDKNIKATGQYVGKEYFSIFPFRILEGKRDEMLKDKNSIALSETMARKLFNTTENIIGKPVRFQQDTDFFVSGVFEDPPYHSSQQFEFALSFEYYKDIQGWVKTWNNTGPHNFITLKKGTDLAAFNHKIAGVVTQNGGDTSRSVFAMPFSDNYLQNTFSHGSRLGGKIEYVRLFSLIALFILAIACINFMNLSTAKASRRLKEVGIKKVVGAGRQQLIIQFLGESMLLTLVAVNLALALVWILLPQFNFITGKQISFGFDSSMLLGLLGITLFTGLLSGSYPALYLSGFKPVKILKGKFNSSHAEIWTRKGLVVFQFTLTVVLIVSVLVVYQQIQFIQHADPGYKKDHVVRFNAEGKLLNAEESFVAALKTLPGVANASYTFHNMVGRNYGTNGLDWVGKDSRESIYFEGVGAGFDFIETMGMQMAAGRSYSREYGNEQSKIILNEAAIRAMQLKNPIGQSVKIYDAEKQIIGVVKDFHFESLHEPVKPLFILEEPQGNPWHKIMVRIRGGQEASTLDQIQKLYESYNPGFPFDYNFLDDIYQKQYLSELRVGILSRYFAGIAIIISCLGLFGLVAFTAQRRQKEIGVRKVVGATVPNIIFMLSKDFLKLILISVLIAFPLSWWAMEQWLHGFAYRISLGPFVFIIAGTSIIFITLLTISFQAIKAAVTSPIKSLRTE